MLKINSLFGFVLTAIGLSAIPAKAASFDKAAFIDTFDDGIVNTSIYSPIGDALIVEENGTMSVTLDTDGEGIEILLGEVLPTANWFGFDFDANGFQIGDSLTISVIESNSLLGEFTSVSLVLTQLNPLIDTKIIYTQPDGTQITIDTPIEVPFAETFDELIQIRFDWIPEGEREIFGYQVDAVTEGFEPGDELLTEIVRRLEAAAGTGAKKVQFIFNGEDDPILTFNAVAADPVHAPEPTTVLSLLALNVLGLPLVLKRARR